MDTDYESVLFVARETYLYQIPPRTSSEGYRAANWGDMGEPLWKGRLRVIEIGSDAPTKAVVRLEDSNTGELFAMCPYTPSKSNPNGGVEAVLDSSRYFVLTLLDAESGQKAYLGMGFPERTESFDFNVALQLDSSITIAPLPNLADISSSNSPTFLPLATTSRRQNPAPISNPSSTSSSSTISPHAPPPGRDFSLKPGETLKINIGGQKRRTPAKVEPVGGLAGAGVGGGGFLLPPPPPPAPRGR